ncbi:MucR family transcriptional regulator [Methylobacterium sp. SI9]|uniref:MucR family transcriptional regulator n=1 Tax=Methylobacterium guangdongense TaxID=3138811 RepID=UPI00313DD24F
MTAHSASVRSYRAIQVPPAQRPNAAAPQPCQLLWVRDLGSSALPPSPEADSEKPSTDQIRKSVRPDGLVSFIDGKAYKTLKRHLTSHGLDPRAYRDRYGLPGDYPMVAPAYAKQRSALAKAIGLGRPGGMAQKAPKKGRKAA